MQTLKEKIDSSGFTRKHIAGKMGISYWTLNRILNNNQPYVSKELLAKLNGYLDDAMKGAKQ